MKTFRLPITVVLLFSLCFSVIPVSAAENKTPEPYKKEEFPGFMHDIHRAEIITFGAMPFVTFNASLGYSFGKFVFHGFDASYFVNPFAKSSDSGYSTDEQVGIILTSLGISLCIGITDFIVHSVKRNIQRKKAKQKLNGSVQINPIETDSDAIKIDIDSEKQEK